MKPEPRKDCADAGHCWHVEGGELYQRHSGQGQGTAPATCCWCGTPAELRTGARSSQASAGLPTITHGRQVEYAKSVQLRVEAEP